MKWVIILAVCLLICSLGVTQGRERGGGDAARLLAATRTTKTAIVLTTSTTTTPFTCARFTNGDVCQRRRFRRFSSVSLKETQGSHLEGSLDETVVDGDVPEVDRNPRVAITIWSTVSSTFTVTSTSINSSTTFSLSFFCTVGGASLPPACG